MKQNIRLFRTSSSLWSKFLDSNPQFFREIRGRFKTRNVVIAAAISVICQFLLVIYLLGQLPEYANTGTQCGRYGTELVFSEVDYHKLCFAQNEAGNWLVNWQLWWLDLFIILSFISIFTLLLVGAHMLIADMAQEKERNTLNFIRLTPQSAGSIPIGKILGVPILLYTAIAFILPLHLVAGLQSNIPFSLIVSFDLAVVASCAFVYCLALLWSLSELNIAGLKPWLASGVLGIFLLLTSVIILEGHSELDRFLVWTLMFNPATVLAYLIDACHLKFGTISYLSTADFDNLSFFGRALWTNATVGMGFILCNFCLWTYWCWSILKRRFYNPQSTLLSKSQSYRLTSCFTLIALGFTLQRDAPCMYCNLPPSNIAHITDNFTYLQVCLSLFGLGLIFALSPHRQTLHDWARYRHQTKNSSLLSELILGENSPAIVAIAFNQIITIALIAPAIFIVLPASRQYLLFGLILSATNIILCAVIAQLILTLKTSKKGIWSILTIGSLNALPAICLGIAGLTVTTAPQAWLFSFAPLGAARLVPIPTIAFALFGQWLAISIVSLQITRKLKQAGASETKLLMDRTNGLKGKR